MTSEKNQNPGTAEQTQETEPGGWLETERIIMEMLRITSSHLPLKETLQQCLDVLLQTTWLRGNTKHSIWLSSTISGKKSLLFARR